MAKMTTRAQMVQRKVGTKKRKKGEGRGVGRVTDLIQAKDQPNIKASSPNLFYL